MMKLKLLNQTMFLWTIIGLLLVILLVNWYYLASPAFFYLRHVDIHWAGYTREKLVALTFDDGPDPRFTPEILEILKENHIPATFFVLGKNVRKYPEIVKEELRLGHEIGNHTYDHQHLNKLTTNEINQELVKTDRVMKRVTGRISHIFRPPYEELDEPILVSTREQEKEMILSTITLEHSSYSCEAEVSRVMQKVFPGAIILAHDGRLNRSETVEALPLLIQALEVKGYKIVSLKQLLGK